MSLETFCHGTSEDWKYVKGEFKWNQGFGVNGIKINRNKVDINSFGSFSVGLAKEEATTSEIYPKSILKR